MINIISNINITLMLMLIMKNNNYTFELFMRLISYSIRDKKVIIAMLVMVTDFYLYYVNKINN